MESLQVRNRYFRFSGLVAILATVLLVVSLFSTLAAAAQLTSRSIELSSPSAGATGVSYDISFTAIDAAGAFIVDFCQNTPLIGQGCTAPAGFDASAVATSAENYTVSSLDANTVLVTHSITATTPVRVALSGISNPEESGIIYARIVTYDTAVNAYNYASNNLGSGAIDDGGVAIVIADTIGVSGAVLETMTFCVSGDDIEANCEGVTPPVLRLGEELGDVVALTSDAVSESNMYAQISTNAMRGVVVSLKSNAFGCGGLMRAGSTSCDILPALDMGVEEGRAHFGVKVGEATDAADDAAGVFGPAVGSGYNSDAFSLNYVIGDVTGVTSTYGDAFLDTGGAPVSNKNVMLTFGASVANNTPAGVYSADMSLIATGRF